MPREIKRGAQAREALHRGVSTVSGAVASTMGPSGRYAIIDNGHDRPVVTKDGVTVARSITLPDRFEEMGSALVKEAAERTNAAAGDGTTLTCVLTGAIYKRLAELAAGGADAAQMARDATVIATEGVSALSEATRAPTGDDIRRVALVSANHDATIAEPVADIMAKVGLDGVVTVATKDSPGLSTSVMDGLKVDAGYASPLMATDRMEAHLMAPMVLMTDKPLKKVEDILPAMKLTSSIGAKSLLVFADDAEHDVIAFVHANRNELPTVIVKTPGFGPERKADILGDLQAKLGGRIVLDAAGHIFANITQDDLGAAQQALVTRDSCLVIGGRGDVGERVQQIETDLTTAEYDFDKDRLKKRRANLYGKLGVIQVGGTTPSETTERKHRVDDTVCATRAAMEHGVIAGGGLALAEIARRLAEKADSPAKRATLDAMSEPRARILANAGYETDDRTGSWHSGTDAKTGKTVDYYEAGIIDPTKVLTEALSNAAAVAALLITTDVIVSEITPKP